MAEMEGDILRSFARECKKSKRGRKLKSCRVEKRGGWHPGIFV
jgi:hypothetical protein